MKSARMNVHHELLRELYLNGIEPNDALTFFAELILTVQQYEYNYGPQKKNNHAKHTMPFYLVKGFYPNTSVMFRFVLIDMVDRDPWAHSDNELYAKVSKATYRLPKTCRFGMSLSKEQQQTLLENKAESIILNANIRSNIATTAYRAPRCISPKGMKLFKLKKGK